MPAPDAFTYGPATEADLAAVSRIMHFSFTAPADPAANPWLGFVGLDALRVLRPGAPGEPVATLGRVPMGQHFGGRSVPMLGVAGVGTAMEARGRGAARLLMEGFIREAAAEGWPLAGLYASTQALYRQSGFEQGGHCFEIKIPVSELAAVCRGASSPHAQAGRELAVRQMAEWAKPGTRWIPPDDVRAVYARFAADYDGTLDRGPYCWSRVRQMREDQFEGFGVYGAGGLEGYVYFMQVRNLATGKHDVQLSDVAWSTPRGAYRLAALLGDMATMGERVVMRQAGPIHPLLTLMPLQHYTVQRREYWMTRITHLPRAIEARGWNPAVRASVHLEVTDALVPGNAGPWTLSVAEGRGTLARRAGPAGGTGGAANGATLRCDIRGLVPLYTGLYSARQAAAFGWVEGDAAAVDGANAVFAGGQPWMGDFF